MLRLCRMYQHLILGLLWTYIFSTGFTVASLEPGYLDFDNLPDTNFSCVEKVIGGYYADLETNCQMFHVCTIGQLDEPMDIRFLCLNGTVFDQETRVCERIDEVDCSKSEKFYSLNLELYGNTAPPILEGNVNAESQVTSSPSTSTTTIRTTSRPKTTTTTTHAPQYFTTSFRPIQSPTYQKNIPSHQFTYRGKPSSDYTPEEININLNPVTLTKVRAEQFDYHRFPHSGHIENNNEKNRVSTPSSVHKSESGSHRHTPLAPDSSQDMQNDERNYNKNQQNPQYTQNTAKFAFNYHDLISDRFKIPHQHNYHYQTNTANLKPPELPHDSFGDNLYRSNTNNRHEYLPVSRKNFDLRHATSTMRSFFLQPIKSPTHQYFSVTDRPQGSQLPVPVLPTLAPIVFSSPAPFTLSRHTDKFQTNDHQQSPRIIISASASVSDASGRTLNYSLGTIGAAQILAQPPSSYDEYNEDDVVLDPFFHDVPKLKNNKRRVKRNIQSNNDREVSQQSRPSRTLQNETAEGLRRTRKASTHDHPSDIIKSEEEAIEVLKFLFDWYKTHEKTTNSPFIQRPISPALISSINEEFSQKSNEPVDYYSDDQAQTLEGRPAHNNYQPTFHKATSEASLYDYKNSYLNSSLHRNRVHTHRNTHRDIGLFDNINEYFSQPDYHIQRNNGVAKQPTRHYSSVPNVKEPKSDYDYHIRNNVHRPFRGRHKYTIPNSVTKTPSGYKEKEQYEDNESGDSLRKYSTTQSPLSEYHRNNVNSPAAVPNILDSKEHSLYFSPSYPTTERTHSLYYSSSYPTTSERTENEKQMVPLNPYQITTAASRTVSDTSTTTIYDSTGISRQEGVDSLFEYTTDRSTLDYITESIPPHSIQNNRNSDKIDDTPKSATTREGTAMKTTTTKIPQTATTVGYSTEIDINETTTSDQVTHIPEKNFFMMYDYVDDNYEAVNHPETPENIKLTKAAETLEPLHRIHEEVSINVENTEKPLENGLDLATDNSKTYEYTEISNENSPNSSQTTLHAQEVSITAYTERNKHKSVTEKVSSLEDFVKSLRDFQKYEEHLYESKNKNKEEKNNLSEAGVGDGVRANIDSQTTTEDSTEIYTSNIHNNKVDEKILNASAAITEPYFETTINNDQKYYRLGSEDSTEIYTSEIHTDYKRTKVPITPSSAPEIFVGSTAHVNRKTYEQHSENSTEVYAPNIHKIFDESISSETLESTTDSDVFDDKKNYENIINRTPHENLNVTIHTNSPAPIPEAYNTLTQTPTEGPLYTSRPLYDTNLIKNINNTASTASTSVNIEPTLITLTETTAPSYSKHTIDPVQNEAHTSNDEKNLVEENRNTSKTDNSLSYQSKPRGRNRYHQRNYESPRRRIESQPKISYSSKYSSRRNNSRRRPQNRPIQFAEVTSSTNAQPSTTSTAVHFNLSNLNEPSVILNDTSEAQISGYSTTTGRLEIQSTTLSSITGTLYDESSGNFISNTAVTPNNPSFETDVKNFNRDQYNFNKPTIDIERKNNNRYTTKTDGEYQTTTTPISHLLEHNTEQGIGFTQGYKLEDQDSSAHLSSNITNEVENSSIPTTETYEHNEKLREVVIPIDTFRSDSDIVFTTESPTSTSIREDESTNSLLEKILNGETTDYSATTNSYNVLDEEITVESSTQRADMADTHYSADVPTTASYGQLNKLIKNIEAITNSTAITELPRFGELTTEPSQELTTDGHQYIQKGSIAKMIEDIEQTTKSMVVSKLEEETGETSTKNYNMESTASGEFTTEYTTNTDKYDLTTTEEIQSTTDGQTLHPDTTMAPGYHSDTSDENKVSDTKSRETTKSTATENTRTYLDENEISNLQQNVKTPATKHRKYNSQKNKQRSQTYFKNAGHRRFSSRHRFSTINVTPFSEQRGKSLNTGKFTHRKTETTSEESDQDASLKKTEIADEIRPTHRFSTKTTPSTLVSMLYKVNLRKEKVNKHFIFNCFGKDLNTFHSDPRDCRLFHYCTHGFTRNQLLDMKFVCDLGTHFDDEKLVCTKEIPQRCL